MWNSINEKLPKALERNGETKDDIVYSTISTEQLNDNYLFFSDYRKSAFTVWTEKYVYFPALYDGNEWVESVPRNPCDVKTEAVGGG